MSFSGCFGGDDDSKPSGKRTAPETQHEVEASLKQRPVIRPARFRQLSGGRMAVSYRVRFPSVGDTTKDAASARLEVRSPRTGHAQVSLKSPRKAVAADGVANYRFTVTGAAARSLRDAGAGTGKPSAELTGMVSLMVAHQRVLKTAVHTVLAQAGGLGSQHSLGGTPKGATFNFYNYTLNDVIVSASKLTCVDDTLNGPSIAAVNGQLLPAQVTDPATGKPYIDPATGKPYASQVPVVSMLVPIDENAQDVATEAVSSPGFFSPEVSNFVTQFANHGAAVIPTYEAVINDLTGNTDCIPGAFMVGFDDVETNGHTEFPIFLTGASEYCPGDVHGNKGNDHPCAYLPNFDQLPPARGINPSFEDLNYTQGLHDVNLLKGEFPTEGDPNGTTDPTVPGKNADGSCGTWNWMTCVYKPGQSDDVRLIDLLVPGTHDSGTTALSDDSTSFLDFESPCRSLSAAVNDIVDVHQWAVTQRQTLRQQLDSGIRYLDLRTAWDDGQGLRPAAWRLAHSQLAPNTLERELRSIADWASAHPNEVVMVSLTACDKPDGDTLFPNQGALEQSLEDSVVCGHTFPFDPASMSLPNTRLGAVRQSKNASGAAGNVILITDYIGKHKGDKHNTYAQWSDGFLSACHPVNNNDSDYVYSFNSVIGPTGPFVNVQSQTESPAKGFDPTLRAPEPPGAVNAWDAAGDIIDEANDSSRTRGGNTLENYKSNPPAGLLLETGSVQWELPTDANGIEGIFGYRNRPRNLLEYGKALLPGSPLAQPNDQAGDTASKNPVDRTGLINLYKCGNILRADNFSEDFDTFGDGPHSWTDTYVQQIVDLNVNRECPVDLFLRATFAIPARQKLTYTLPDGFSVDGRLLGALEPQFNLPATVKLGVDGDVDPDTDYASAFTIKNTGKAPFEQGGIQIPIVSAKGYPSSITLQGPATPVKRAGVTMKIGPAGPIVQPHEGAGPVKLQVIQPGS